MKIKFGAVIVAGSGKIGGHVASKNRSGAYLRTKVTPVNPQTPAQTNARALLASLSTGWSGLTAAQRVSFNEAVTDFASTDIFGDIKQPSGINLYVKLNANNSRAGFTLLTIAPTKGTVPFAPLSSANFKLTTSSLDLVFGTTALATSMLTIRACAPQSAGKSFVKSEMRVILTKVNSATLKTEMYTAYVAKFGQPQVGANIFVSIEAMLSTGQVGQIQQIKATVTT